MSQLLTQFKLDYGKYFDQPPDPRESTPSTADPDNIFNFSNQLREDLQPTNGLAPKTTNPNSEKVSDIVSDIKDKAMKSTNESKFEGAEIGGGMEQTDVVKTNPDVVVEQIKEAAQSVPDPNSTRAVPKVNTEQAGALSFNNSRLPAGSLVFNEEGLRRLKKGDDIKGAGAVTAALVSSLIASAPQIIKAISDVRKANTEKASGKIGGRWMKKCGGSDVNKLYHLSELSDDKLDELESVMKKIRGQDRYLSGSGVIGSGKVSDWMSDAWNKLKTIYNNKQFKPIKNALVTAASNTAQKYIDKGADTLASKTNNEDLKNVINTTRDVASNLKNEAIDQVNGRGSVFRGGSVVSSVECGGGLHVRRSNIDDEVDDYDMMSVGVKVYDDSVTNDPVEETENKGRVYKSLNGVGGFRTQAVSCGKLRAVRTKRLAFDLNMPGVRMSDLRSVQFDVRDRHGEVVSIASDIYINIRLSVNGKV
ncbi:hypothetical protein WA171_001873 [Blastocystis sp. BT1]